MLLTSPSFKDGEMIPKKFTCEGGNINPQFDIHNVSEDAKSLSLIMHDPDAPKGKPKYYTAAQVDGLQAELAEARNAADTERRHAADAIANEHQEYPSKLQFAYGTLKYEKPFLVRAIWHDGRFTYIKTDATELPALYELKDGEPAIVNFQVRGNTYVVPKVIDRGYLALGKERFSFAQQGR